MSLVSFVAVFLSLFDSSVGFLVVPSSRLPVSARSPALSNHGGDYLSSLSRGETIPSTMDPPKSPSAYKYAPAYKYATGESTEIIDRGHHDEENSAITFSHAPISHFALEKLTPKGPRKNADIGQPHDATRAFIKGESTSVGSWWCAAGGWPSLMQRDTTEIFYVFSGHGCLSDLDNTKHYFGPGDTVVLPKGWSGRWDVLEDIHKVWVVHDHPNIEETSNPIRAVITRYNSLAPQHLNPQGLLADATHGTSPSTSSRIIYDVGPTKVGFWTCTPGSFPVINRSTTTKCFHVLEGVLFLSNGDGSAQRCVAGDTVVLPKDWTGDWDVIETVKKLWVDTE